MPLFCDSFRAAYLGAVEREVAEEVAVGSAHDEQVVALINDDSTSVGKVHLGIVHHWTLDEPRVERREQMITQLTFMRIEELQAVREELESWSAFCLDYIASGASDDRTNQNPPCQVGGRCAGAARTRPARP
jgi:predicted NUDIX family phosphoesterase